MKKRTEGLGKAAWGSYKDVVLRIKVDYGSGMI